MSRGARAGLALLLALALTLLLTGCARPAATDPAAERRRLGLPAAVAVVAALGVGAMVLRVVRAEPPDGRRGPSGTERP